MTSGFHEGTTKLFLLTDLERMSDYDPGTKFISPLTKRAKDQANARLEKARSAMQSDDFYKSAEYHHEVRTIVC